MPSFANQKKNLYMIIRRKKVTDRAKAKIFLIMSTRLMWQEQSRMWNVATSLFACFFGIDGTAATSLIVSTAGDI